MQSENNSYLKKLADVFDKADNQQNLDQLVLLFYIYKLLLGLGDQRLIETLVSDQFYMSTFGALEYDPDVTTEQATEETKHRLFFSEKARFK